MKCVLFEGCVAFIKGLVVKNVFSSATGGVVLNPPPLTTIAKGTEVPTSHGWRLVKRARQAMSHQRPRRRH